MKNCVLMLRIAGAIDLLFVVFHVLFNKLFDWDNTLSCLSQVNRSIFLTYHAIVILVLLFMGVVSLVQPKAILGSLLRYSVLGMCILFFVIRIVTEFTLFSAFRQPSPVILLMCALPTVCYTVPMFFSQKY